MTRSIPLFLAALASLALPLSALAQKLKDPAAAGSSMAVLQVTVSKAHLFGSSDIPADDARIGRFNDKGEMEAEIRPTARYKNYIFFENLAPGRYKVLAAVHIVTMRVAGQPTQLGGGFSLNNDTTFGKPGVIRFAPEVMELSSVELRPASVAFLGDFTAKVSLKATFPMATPVVDASSGTRTPEGEARAFAMLKAEYPDSPWTQRIPKDSPPQQTAAPQPAAAPQQAPAPQPQQDSPPQKEAASQ